MTSLQDIIKLVQNDTGKTFIMDESGDIKLVILGVDEYERLLLGKLKHQIEDIESINRQITEAQLAEAPIMPNTYTSSPKPQRVDLRAEVMDPNFDYGSGDDEAIQTEFEDI